MSAQGRAGARWRRIRALVIKEARQLIRDPSSLVVGFVLPVLLLLLFGFGISFDATRVKVGLVIEAPSPDTAWFFASLSNTPFFEVHQTTDRRVFYDDLAAGRLNGLIALSGDFTERLARGDSAGVQVITDGSDPNTANLISGYVLGAWNSWIQQRALTAGQTTAAFITIEPRFWYNPELESRRFLVPGSIALILMMIGALSTQHEARRFIEGFN